MPTIEERLYRFLDKVKQDKVIRAKDMNEEEVHFADELVRKKLLSKFNTRIEIIYTYGATLNGFKENEK